MQKIKLNCESSVRTRPNNTQLEQVLKRFDQLNIN